MNKLNVITCAWILASNISACKPNQPQETHTIELPKDNELISDHEEFPSTALEISQYALEICYPIKSAGNVKEYELCTEAIMREAMDRVIEIFKKETDEACDMTELITDPQVSPDGRELYRQLSLNCYENVLEAELERVNEGL